MTEKINFRKLEAGPWETADLLRAGSKLTSSQYCISAMNALVGNLMTDLRQIIDDARIHVASALSNHHAA